MFHVYSDASCIMWYHVDVCIWSILSIQIVDKFSACGEIFFDGFVILEERTYMISMGRF